MRITITADDYVGGKLISTSLRYNCVEIDTARNDIICETVGRLRRDIEIEAAKLKHHNPITQEEA